MAPAGRPVATQVVPFPVPVGLHRRLRKLEPAVVRRLQGKLKLPGRPVRLGKVVRLGKPMLKVPWLRVLR